CWGIPTLDPEQRQFDKILAVQSVFPHRVVVALQLAAHRDVAFRTTGEPDAGVPESDKVIDRQHAGGAVVTGYESGGDLLGESVHQDDGESAREQGPVTLVRGAGVGVPTRDEEDPRDIAFQQEFDVFVLGDTSWRSEEHTSELQSRFDLVCRLLLEKKNEECDINRTGDTFQTVSE